MGESLLVVLVVSVAFDLSIAVVVAFFAVVVSDVFVVGFFYYCGWCY